MEGTSTSRFAVAKSRLNELGVIPMEVEVVIDANSDEMDYDHSDGMEEDDCDEMEGDGRDAMEDFQQLSINESTDHSMEHHGRFYGR